MVRLWTGRIWLAPCLPSKLAALGWFVLFRRVGLAIKFAALGVIDRLFWPVSGWVRHTGLAPCLPAALG